MDDHSLGALLLQNPMMREEDLERCLAIQQLTGAPWGGPGTYDISVDTSVLGIEGTSALVLAATEKSKVKGEK